MRERTWVLSCGNGDVVPDDLAQELSHEGASLVIQDLCRVCLAQPERLALAVTERVCIVCYRPRAVRALLEACDQWPGEERVTWHVPQSPPREVHRTQPWYPVVDRQRCTDCGQCHAFCLFSVYNRNDAAEVSVERPLNCKEKCPACARICPEAAIIFPLLEESPLNGDAVDDDYTARAQADREQARLMESDPYRMLKARRAAQKRQLVDPEKFEKALAERERCRRQHEDDV